MKRSSESQGLQVLEEGFPTFFGLSGGESGLDAWSGLVLIRKFLHPLLGGAELRARGLRGGWCRSSGVRVWRTRDLDTGFTMSRAAR